VYSIVIHRGERSSPRQAPISGIKAHGGDVHDLAVFIDEAGPGLPSVAVEEVEDVILAGFFGVVEIDSSAFPVTRSPASSSTEESSLQSLQQSSDMDGSFMSEHCMRSGRKRSSYRESRAGIGLNLPVLDNRVEEESSKIIGAPSFGSG
jgi:hypothetical protein